MRRAKQLWQWLRSTATKLRQQTIGLPSKFASWPEKTKSQQAHKLIMPLGVLIGTVAFGLWSQSFTASLFAGIVLFFAAGIYKRNEQMLATLRKSDALPQVESLTPTLFSGQPRRTVPRSTRR